MTRDNTRPALTNKNPYVLVVDDQPDLLDSLRMLLHSEGYRVDTATGGAIALTQLAVNDYDAVLLDLQMPDLSGHEVIKYVARSKPHIQTIVVSGETSFESVRTCMQEGAYDYVRKPYIPDEILTTLANALKARALRLQHATMEKALRESEQLHRYIVNNSPDLVYMLDDRGRFTFVNDTLIRLLQYDRQDLIGKHYSVLVHEEDMEAARFVFNERRTGDRSSRHVELRLRCRNPRHGVRHFDNHVLPIELHSTGVYQSDASLEPGRKFSGTHGVAKDITLRKKTEKLINYQAYHDLLTNLPNRALFNDRLHQALAHVRRNNGSLAVMFLDLDRFKTINDSLGHAMGDQLLQSVTSRLKRCLREEDTLSRFGGDEFTLLLPNIQHRDDASAIATKVMDQLSKPFVISGHEMHVSASIGIALYPEAGDSMEVLCKKADIAMYYVKANGKSGFKFFNEEMNNEFTSRVTLERDLRKALEENQFHVFFQPKVDSANGSVVGLECLIRWQHPTRGLVLPGEFIPLAEETNLIVPLGAWAFEATCAEIARWNSQGITPVVVSVNVSARQLEQADFANFVLNTLDKYQVPAKQVELEITENAIINNRKGVINKLTRLSRKGVRIAIDDFGTGYCSLAYLQQFPIHTLKIDRSFINDIRDDKSDACIVNAIISLAQGLKLHLVAEGVETRHQLDYLKRLGCTEVQGHSFSAALSAEHTLDMLSDITPRFEAHLH